MKKLVLAMGLVSLASATQLQAREGYDLYSGTTTDDFNKGGKFDLGTVQGDYDFRVHNGQPDLMRENAELVKAKNYLSDKYNYVKIEELIINGYVNQVNARIDEINEKTTHFQGNMSTDGYQPYVENGKTYFDLNVFNSGYGVGALVVYDKNGDIFDIHKVDSGAPATSIVQNISELFTKKYDGLTDDYAWNDKRDGAIAKKTELKKIEIPEGGRFEISKNSDVARTLSVLEIASNSAGLLPTDFKFTKNTAFVKNLLIELTKSGMLDMLKDPQWMKKKDAPERLLDTLALVVKTAEKMDIYKDLFLDPANFDLRTKVGKFVKETSNKSIGSYAKAAEMIAISLNALGILNDVGTTKFQMNGNYNDIVSDYTYIVGNNEPKNNKLEKSVLQPPIIAFTQCQNSHIGCAQPYFIQPNITKTEATLKKLTQTGSLSATNISGLTTKTGLQQATVGNTALAIPTSDWTVTKGDPSIHLSAGKDFGSIVTPNGNPITALNNANVDTTIMERSFSIPNGIKSISTGFNANFVTNEFPDYVGSEFNDTVKIDVITGSGNQYTFTPFKKDVNTSQLTAVTGLPNPLSPSGGQTGFQKVALDNIPVANGGQVTIRVTAQNVGDTAYPSAILINDNQVKK